MAKYIIETNMTDDDFGAFVPGLGCRNVGIDELKGYYYWPGEVFSIFMDICNHVIPRTMTFCDGCTMVAMLSDSEHWLHFKCISDEEAKKSGLQEFNFIRWMEQLREDKKQNKNYKNYNK